MMTCLSSNEKRMEKHLHLFNSSLTRVVGRPEDPDVHVGPLCNPLGDGVGAEAQPLDIHGVQLLGLPLLREVHEDRRRVELHDLEGVGALVEIHHGEEQPGRGGKNG